VLVGYGFSVWLIPFVWFSNCLMIRSWRETKRERFSLFLVRYWVVYLLSLDCFGIVWGLWQYENLKRDESDGYNWHDHHNHSAALCISVLSFFLSIRSSSSLDICTLLATLYSL